MWVHRRHPAAPAPARALAAGRAANEEGPPGAPAGGEAAHAWLESIPAIAWRTDAQARIVARNRRWYEYTGCSPERSSGEDWLEVVHPDDLPALVAAVQAAVATGGPLECEFRVRRADGAYRWFLGRAQPDRDAAGQVVGWTGLGTDIEDRRRAEEALREADRRKNEFLGVLSHELRNPLAPITTSVFLLERLDPSSAGAGRAREVIGRQTAHLARLVDDLLDVTRIVRGKIELRRARLDLRELVRQAGEDHRPVIEGRGLALAVELPGAPVWVDGDATRILQMVGNLLQNAAKFTPGGGHVLLALAAREAVADIAVQDDGPGIAPEVMEHMFEPFAQGPQELSRPQGGLGLGLALVKGLATLHGGDVSARSAGPGRGTEVVVRLPAVR